MSILTPRPTIAPAPASPVSRRPAPSVPRPVAVLPERLGQVAHGKLRLVKRGPWIPARCWIVDGDRDPETGELLSDQRLACQIHDERPRWARDWWPFGWPWRPIPAADWRYLMELTAWARQWRPSHPLCNPRAPVDPDSAEMF